MIKRNALVLGLALAGAGWGYAGQRAITIEEAVRLALDVGPSARAIALTTERAMAEEEAAGRWENPSISLSREETGGTSETFASLTLPLPIAGRPGLERSAARLAREGTEAAARQGRADLVALVREAFLDLLAAQEREAVLADTWVSLDELTGILKAREREGESSGFDLLRVERELAAIAAERIVARGQVAVLRIHLGVLVALPAEELVAEGDLQATAPLIPLDRALLAADARGDLAALDSEANRLETLSKAAGRRIVPDLALVAGNKTTRIDGFGEESGPIVGLALSLPVFDPGRRSSRALAVDGTLARARREALAQRARAEVRAAHAEAGSRREAEQVYATAGDPAALVAMARAAYEAGEMRILDLVDAYRTVLESRLNTIDLRAAARRAETRLARAIGYEAAP